MRRLLLVPLVMIGLLVAAMQLSGGATEPKPDFVFVNRGEISTLDPNRMSWLQDIRIAYCLWEGLYTLDPVTLEPIPGAADKIDLSDDKLVYTFHLRADGKWSNGDPVVTGNFVFAWRRMLETPGDYTELLFRIRGAKEYSESFTAGKQPNFKSVGIEALDDRTLKVTLEHPVSYFRDLLAFPPFFPLNEKSMEEFLQRDEQNNLVRDAKTGVVQYDQKFTQPGKLVSNGPYKLDKWEFHKRLRLVASDYYWNRASVVSKIIDQVSVADQLAVFLSYESRAVDFVAEVPGEVAAELKLKGRSDLHVFPGFGTYFYSFNCRPKLPDGSPNPFADVRVRQAFCMAVDKQPIVDNVTRLGQPVATRYIPPDIFANYQSPDGLPYDVDRARKLLAEAGYPEGRGFPHLTLLFNNDGDHSPIAQIVRKQWADHLGVDLSLEGIEIKSFRERLHNKNYSIARASWMGDYEDPSTFTDKYKSDSENNDSDWKSPAYDALCAAAAVEPDSAKRLKLLEKAEKLLLDESPILPLYHYVNAYLFRDTVTGISLNPRQMVMLQAAKAKR